MIVSIFIAVSTILATLGLFYEKAVIPLWVYYIIQLIQYLMALSLLISAKNTLKQYGLEHSLEGQIPPYEEIKDSSVIYGLVNAIPFIILFFGGYVNLMGLIILNGLMVVIIELVYKGFFNER